MTTIAAGVVDVQVLRPGPDRTWEVLALRRGTDTRCTGAWEIVHGRVEPGERPEDAALRELFEETGLRAERLYSVTVQPFYLHGMRSVQLAVVFAAIVKDGIVELGAEHDSALWVTPSYANELLAWPREKESLAHALALLAGGDAGAVEDVLRVV